MRNKPRITDLSNYVVVVQLSEIGNTCSDTGFKGEVITTVVSEI